MISATHVGKNTTPVRAQNDHICYRCGIRWIDSSWTYCPGAPCFDCRQMLCEQFGIIMRYWRRPRAGVLAPCEVSA